MAKRDSYTDLLIIGAGPAGLMAACWASQYAITTRLIDLKSERTAAGHADGINSRTMEILDSFGLADTVLRQAAGIWMRHIGYVIIACFLRGTFYSFTIGTQ